MSNDHIDASFGLAYSLGIFERYRKNGTLQAELHHVPGIRGRCMAYLYLIEGKVTVCYIEKNGARQPIARTTLIRVDAERGPFKWTLQPLSAPPVQLLNISQSFDQSEGQRPPTPRLIAPLDMGLLQGWTISQRLRLTLVYDAIDGKKTTEEIQKVVHLPPNTIKEALRILLTMKVIIIVQ